MYEVSFGLKRRPFAATPDATCFLAAGPIQAALDELVVCVQQGQGIAVLTAPAGTGKTLLCERLRVELDERYETVFLRHASFLTRRALLQTILCELSHAYHHPSEQELRLELFPAIRALQPKREALVLICDEAHQLSDSLLEELRILADFAEAGQPLVRLVLVGQPSLEDKLAQAGLEAFNQRIRAHISLSTFDHAESLDYLDYRVTWSGGRTSEIFTADALDMIARASDGVPRCMNQLADHSLLLAYVAEQHPVNVDLVREALNDLRQLPLHWNEPTTPRSSSSHLSDDDRDYLPALTTEHEPTSSLVVHEVGKTYSFEPEFESSQPETDSISFEVGAPVATFASNDATKIGRTDIGTDDWRRTVDSFTPHSTESLLIEAMKGLLPEPEPVVENEATRAKLSRRIEFHELLHDAYIGAAERAGGNVDHQYQNAFVSGAATSSRVNDAPAPAAFTVGPQTTSSNDFQEEIVVDRYTSIDAGFAPPVISVPDTPKASRVHAEHNESPIPQESSKSTSETDAPAIESQGEEVSGRRFVDVRNNHESSTFESIIASLKIGESHGDSDEPVSPFVGQMKKSFRVDHDEEHTEFSSDSQSPHLPADIDDVARSVFSLGESLRSTGILSSSTESILKSIHSEIGDDSHTIEADSLPQPPPVPAHVAWESVETPQIVQQGTDSRPFRYLFSMLRRKQKGL